MRVLVTGSRDWTDGVRIWDELGKLIASAKEEPRWNHVIVVHGDCPTGADSITDAICKEENVAVERHPAHWMRYGKAAGPMRNADMVKLGADVCLAFIKNGSYGATHCAHLAEKAGIPTIRFTEDSP